MGSPMADHREKRPPTQSHISKMLSLPTPKATAFSTLEDTAIKCRLVVLSLPPLFKNHVRAVLAFSVVSGVVKLLDATTNKVVPALTCRSTSAICAPSTLDT